MKGSLCFFAGFVLIAIGWYGFTFAGFMMQLYGLFLLFREFIKTILGAAETMPVIGPVIRQMPWLHTAVDYVASDKKA